MKITHFFVLIALLTASNALAQNGGNFYCNPLLLNGKPFNTQRFFLETRGKLSLMTGDPKTAKSAQVPITVTLRRKGKTIAERSTSDKGTCFEVDINELMSKANPGDELVVEPLLPDAKKAKQTLIIKGKPLFAILLGTDEDDC
jgi:hypothetical protein